MNPTAAALAFGVDTSKEGDEAHYMILDLGGGTFDISLLEVFNGIFEIHAPAGDNYLGGKGFTDAIVQDLLYHYTVSPTKMGGSSIYAKTPN